MLTQSAVLLKRCAAVLLLAAGLGGCAVYGPPYAGYDPYYGGNGYSSYVGPPVELNLGLGYYSSPHYYRGDHGWRDGRGYHPRRDWRDGRGRGRH